MGAAYLYLDDGASRDLRLKSLRGLAGDAKSEADITMAALVPGG